MSGSVGLGLAVAARGLGGGRGQDAPGVDPESGRAGGAGQQLVRMALRLKYCDPSPRSDSIERVRGEGIAGSGSR